MNNLHRFQTTRRTFRWLLLIGLLLANAPATYSQNKIDEAKKARNTAQDAVDEAQKAVKDHIQENKEAAQKQSKPSHGSDEELAKLRQKLVEAEAKLEAAKADLELEEAAKALEDAESALKTEKNRNPKDKQKLKEAQNARDKAKKLHDALKKVAASAKDHATEVAKKPGSIDKIREAHKKLDDARKAVEKLKAENAVEAAEEEVNREKDKPDRDTEALKQAMDKLKAARDSLDRLNKKLMLNSMNGNFYFSFSISGQQILGRLAATSVEAEELAAAAAYPDIAGVLFETFGGEYAVGEFSRSDGQGYELAARSRIMPFLRLASGFGGRFELGLSGALYRHQWTGKFPVTVFPFDSESNGVPYTVEGSLNASSSRLAVSTDFRCYLLKGHIRPYLNVGGTVVWVLESGRQATISGVSLPIKPYPNTGPEYIYFGGAGLQTRLTDHWFAEAGVAFDHRTHPEVFPLIHFGAGFRF